MEHPLSLVFEIDGYFAPGAILREFAHGLSTSISSNLISIISFTLNVTH